MVFLLLPITSLIVALTQAVQAPGPLFYVQTRAGLQNRTFRCFKYRTMYAANHDATVQAKVNDERIYPAARWFRKLSIDELPQFINVLLNDMSVVGPRPHLVEHNDKFANITQNYHRAFIKPASPAWHRSAATAVKSSRRRRAARLSRDLRCQRRLKTPRRS